MRVDILLLFLLYRYSCVIIKFCITSPASESGRRPRLRVCSALETTTTTTTRDGRKSIGCMRVFTVPWRVTFNFNIIFFFFFYHVIVSADTHTTSRKGPYVLYSLLPLLLLLLLHAFLLLLLFITCIRVYIISTRLTGTRAHTHPLEPYADWVTHLRGGVFVL